MEIKKGLLLEYTQYCNKNNEDAYSKAIVDCGETFGKFIDEGKTFDEAEKAMLATPDGNGMTGFMMGALMSSVSHFHPRGDEIKDWWNKQHGGTPDENTGVNNPALITI